MYCKSDGMSVGKFLVERNVIDESPKYQRESGIWSPEKQQLFLDSLFNEFDVPKIYLHELRGKNSRYHFAIIDGKQRLYAIWRFLNDEIALAQDFELYDKVKAKEHPLSGGSKYSALSTWWQETFKNTPLTVTFVHDADEEDIEELFSRLNNGEPLSAAEKRNAKAGDMVELIREVSKMSFFAQRVTFGNKRLQHHEVAAKFLLLEFTEETTGDPFSDLKKRFLDRMVENNRNLASAVRERLLKRVTDGMKRLNRVFGKADPLLSKQAYAPVYYLFLKVMTGEYAHPDMFSRLKTFIEGFHSELRMNLEKKEEERDPVLLEFGRLMQQGTNDLNSLRGRINILRRYFLLAFSDVEILDRKREFTYEERLAIWIIGNKKCAKCEKELRELSEMHADHMKQWAHGGKTTLANARALCESCNQEEKSTF